MSYPTIPKVIHLTPDFAAAHQYNLQLAKALRALGVHLKTIREKSFLKPVLAFHPDVVHVHWLHSFIETDADNESFLSCLLRVIGFAMQLAVIAARGIKIVWTVHELDIPETHHPKLDRLCIKLVTSLSRAIITHCVNAQMLVTQAYCCASPRKVKVVPHGHFIEVTENRISRSDARQSLKIPESTFVVLFFGLIRPYKGVAELVEAHRKLNREDVLLLIVGSSVMHHQQCADYMAAVEQSIAGRKNVRLVAEFIADEQIQTFMNASDVAAFPYQNIMTSGALIMAMGFGKPCIASRLGCISETLDDKGAFLYEATDKLGLLNAFTACLENAGRLKEMGEHNRNLAENMNWQRIAALTLNVYQDCLGRT